MNFNFENINSQIANIHPKTTKYAGLKIANVTLNLILKNLKIYK